MAITSGGIDALKQDKQLAGAASNRVTIDLALRTLIAVPRQLTAVERVAGRCFETG